MIYYHRRSNERILGFVSDDKWEAIYFDLNSGDIIRRAVAGWATIEFDEVTVSGQPCQPPEKSTELVAMLPHDEGAMSGVLVAADEELGFVGVKRITEPMSPWIEAAAEDFETWMNRNKTS